VTDAVHLHRMTRSALNGRLKRTSSAATLSV
jgi:hypothetical protein